MDKPNVVVFVMDTQRVKNMTCYGYHKPTTPNIDKLAEEATLFEHHYTNGCWTTPTHASLFTGRYVWGHGCGAANTFLEQSLPTMAEIFNRQGYRSGAFCANEWVMDVETGNSRGFQTQREREAFKEGWEEKEETQAAEIIRQGLEWIDSGDDPFLIYFNSLEPHLSCWPVQPFRSRFLLEGASDEEAAAINQGGMDIIIGRQERSARDWEIMKTLNDGETAALDQQIGLLLDALRQRKILDNTIFVLLSDHGDTYDEHPGHHDHWFIAAWDTMLHTPLIIRFPDGRGKGTRVFSLVQTCDILPTLIEALDIKDEELARTPMQGISLLGAMDGNPKRDFALSEVQKPLLFLDRLHKRRPEIDPRIFNRYFKAYRQWPYKYIWSSDMKYDGLYKTAEDPDEQNNLIQQQPDLAASMQSKMYALLDNLDHRDFGDCIRTTGGKKCAPESKTLLQVTDIWRDAQTGRFHPERESKLNV